MACAPADVPPAPASPPAPDEGKRWRDLRKRLLSALVLGPACVGCIWLGAEAWTALVAVAVAVLAWEWVHLCGLRTRVLPGLAVPLAVWVGALLAVAQRPVLALLSLLASFGLTWAGAARQDQGERPVFSGFWLALGVLYIGLSGVALIGLRDDDAAGRANVLFLFTVVWASDIGAYVAGRAVGGPKLAPAISPGKTWSGAAGGLAAAMAVGSLVAASLLPGHALEAALAAAALGVVSQLGDLLESAIKRRFRVKDTSSLIPGHGGLLDRLDGVLAAAPVAALLAAAQGMGAPLWR